MSPQSLAGRAGRHYGQCPDCGKARWGSRREAKEAAKVLHPGHHLQPYRCGDFFHFGHPPPAVIRGALDRRELLR